MKAGVKDYMRKVIKDEILAKFTEWRRRCCQFAPCVCVSLCRRVARIHQAH